MGIPFKLPLPIPPDGSFSLIGLPEGYYDVNIVPTGGEYEDTTLAEVKVSAGEDIDLGVIVLRRIP